MALRRGPRLPAPGSDGEVIAASLDDPERFGAIFERHGDTIFRYLARRVARLDAIDLTGETFRLVLGDPANWSVEIADETVVRRVIGLTVEPGSQGIFEALRPGRTTLTATGGLVCPPGQACPAIARVFQVTLLVR